MVIATHRTLCYENWNKNETKKISIDLFTRDQLKEILLHTMQHLTDWMRVVPEYEKWKNLERDFFNFFQRVHNAIQEPQSSISIPMVKIYISKYEASLLLILLESEHYPHEEFDLSDDGPARGLEELKNTLWHLLYL